MRIPFSRFVVCDRSMEPVFFGGDHVLTFNWVKPHAGDVVVFKSQNLLKVKRVKKLSGGLIYVEGDNKKFSSRQKPISKKNFVGKVILKY